MDADAEYFDSLAQRLKYIREVNALSQKEFADSIGVNNTATVSHYENGRNEPSMNVLVKIAQQFAINLHWLITGKGTVLFSDIPVDNTSDENGLIPVSLPPLFRKVYSILTAGGYSQEEASQLCIALSDKNSIAIKIVLSVIKATSGSKDDLIALQGVIDGLKLSKGL